MNEQVNFPVLSDYKIFLEDLYDTYETQKGKRLLRIKKIYSDAKGKHIVYLDSINKEVFNSHKEAAEYVYKLSLVLTRYLEDLIQYYNGIQFKIQPLVLCLSGNDFILYNKIKHEIDEEIYQLSFRYAGHDNHMFFKKLKNIQERITQLSLIKPIEPNINHLNYGRNIII
ncbi:hypothetical protein MYP_1472 [Sporocytophaga myxococcoides]|uniref:Uncharacterized protein n=1 Tax=Sporocytophaga myxococcoides TaxID=153721 RepID=A0A098LCX4_9BACT|nr:hypothetical protein [Sporocytophaga myxococcoides]GAL84244.1 hypothetical protein MYP_1472 [Sporocytophaga myxococcoides]